MYLVIDMMKYATKRFFNNPGSRNRNTYKLKYSVRTNAEEVVKVGKEDWQAYIESFKDGCDINNIIKRIYNGDLTALSVRNGFYGDISEAPDSLQEALNAKLQIDQMYQNLPEDVKKKFGSVNEFISSTGSEEWFANLGVKMEEEKEVVNNEQE